MKPAPASLLLVLAWAGVTPAHARPVSFAYEVQPLLAGNCYTCHGPDEKERKGGPRGSSGLRLDTSEGAMMDLGGKQAIVPGHPEQSDLIARLTTHDPDEVMPPKKSGKRFTEAEVELVRTWIAQGAKYSRHWSYEKPVRPELPLTGVHPVDAFVQARLVKEKLKQQPEADRRTLIRRVALDLTGLPPAPEDVAAYLADAAPDAYERLVDRLLSSPAYGEHWGRQWLDMARYADSAGYADDPPRSIWAFRDYVINAYNANKPFDQFTIEQIAGDMLPGATPEQIIATAFHRNTMTNSEGGTNDEEFRNAAVIDRVNTTLGVWMGTSMACAQCHTHKYDPITQREYFQVYAMLNQTADADLRDEAPLHSFYTPEQEALRTKLEAERKGLEQQFQNPAPEVQAAAAAWVQANTGPVPWAPGIPDKVKSTAGLTMSVEPDGTVHVPQKADRDTYTIELHFTAEKSVSGIRLDTLPHNSLPAQGAGHGGGNFVITGVSASLIPANAGQPMPAQYVRIELPGKGRLLQLAEVQVFSGNTNLAPQGSATQKSTYADAAASRANDGNTAAEYNSGSVSHTADNTEDPWWELDLKSVSNVDRVVVWNRAEASERLDGFRIVLLNAQRQVVWEQAGNAAAAQVPFSLTGARTIPLSDAQADYTQANFSAESVLTTDSGKPARKRKKAGEKGWAVGGAQALPHSLTLVTAAPVTLEAGARLVITIAQESPHAGHNVGRFRLSTSSDPRLADHVNMPEDIAAALALPAAERTPAMGKALADYYVREISPALEEARQSIAKATAQLAEMPKSTVPVMQELPAEKHRKSHVQLRGNWLSLGDEVTGGVPAAFHPLPPGAPADRLALARWLVDGENPLTARVIANRYWEALFGIGLVRTSEEFGIQGELPSHPELLDWLAVELMHGKWDLKKFLKLLVTSGTYRQSSKVAPGMAAQDPENRLLARGPRVRLSAEMIRDQALAAGGLLTAKTGGPSVRPERPNMGLSAAFGGGLDWQTSTGADKFRRALYTEWRRTSPYPSMTTFDAPSRETCTLRRNRTNTPLQALVTLNDPVFIETAQALARRISTQAGSPEDRIRQAFLLALSREPSASESQRLVQLWQESLETFRKDEARAVSMATVPLGPLPPGAAAAELAAWTAVANVILNLDETLMKR